MLWKYQNKKHLTTKVTKGHKNKKTKQNQLNKQPQNKRKQKVKLLTKCVYYYNLFFCVLFDSSHN